MIKTLNDRNLIRFTSSLYICKSRTEGRVSGRGEGVQFSYLKVPVTVWNIIAGLSSVTEDLPR